MPVFVSHSSKDAYFVRLLARLLEFHGLEYWYSARNLRAGDRFGVAIDEALRSADVMLLVVSEAALQSEWVSYEISSFRTIAPSGRIIPLLLTEVDPGSLARLNIADLQSINFYECFNAGFEALFQALGHQFLRPRIQQRTGERRLSSVRQRLRAGFWKSYHEATGHGKFDEFDLRYSQIQKLIEVLKAAALSYSFTTRDGEPCATDEIVEAATRDVCRGFGSAKAKAITVVEDVAESLWERYNVIPKERRKAQSTTG